MTAITQEDLDQVPPWPDEAAPSTLEPRFVDQDADTLVRCEEQWLVKFLWPLVGVCFVAGASGSGKSFWIIEQISRIARGLWVLGRRSLKSGVIYVAAEGANGVRTRFEALRDRVGLWDGMIRVITEPPNLTNVADVAALLLRMTTIKREMNDRGHRLGVIVVDTLSATVPGADENSAKDMGPVLQLLQKMAIELGTCVIVIAHHGKDTERGVRGWSGQHANADGVIFIQAPDEEGTRVGLIAKVKDGEAGEKFAFALEVVDLGVDVDGDPVTSCVIEERSVPVKPKLSRATGPGAQAELIMRAYERLDAAMVDIPASAGAPRGTRGVALADLRSSAFELGLQGETRPADDDDEALKRRWVEARKKAFQRALHKLVDTKALRQEAELVWAT